MKINEIKNLQQFDVIEKLNEESNYEHLDYSVYYVLYNRKSKYEIEAIQGFYDMNKKDLVFLDFTRRNIPYDDLLLFYELICKAGE